MDTLSLNSSEPIVLTAPTPASDHERKRPGVAFLLSLLYPGLGHLYCRKIQHGLVTAGFFTGVMALVLRLNPTENAAFWGVAIRAAIVLYGFGFLDAFYAAREINAGVDQYMIGNNPRIAAMLNLLTAGFGYFYLGERKKGLIWFFISRILSSTAANRSSVIAVLVELACVVVAADAYRIARRQLRETFPDESTDPFGAPSKSLSPLVPLVLGVLLVFNYFVLVFMGLLMPDYSKHGQSQLLASGADGSSVIEHPAYGVKMQIPAGWISMAKPNDFVLGASYKEFGCQVGLMMNPNLPWQGQQGLARRMEAEVKRNNASYQWLSEGPAAIGDKKAYVLNFQATYKTIPVLEKIVFLQHGLTLYSFIEASSVGGAGECGPMMDDILKSVKLNF
jgi:hypothetical protein